MKINPQSFFGFCANHASLLRALAERGGEISEAEAMRLIRANPGVGEELLETAWRRLRDLQILVPTEPGSEMLFMADPVARLLMYLFNEANPATPEMIRGYVLSLETTASAWPAPWMRKTFNTSSSPSKKSARHCAASMRIWTRRNTQFLAKSRAIRPSAPGFRCGRSISALFTGWNVM